MSDSERRGRPIRRVLLPAIALLGACLLAGCAGVGLSGREVELLEASTADARFMSRTWSYRSAAERRGFARENARRWTYFNDLVHGRRPAPDDGAEPDAAPQAPAGGEPSEETAEPAGSAANPPARPAGAGEADERKEAPCDE